ncbi:hypothetical protein ACHAWT_010854 [Skeletonema menzelii]
MDSSNWVDPFAASGDNNITANDEAIARAMAESMAGEMNSSCTATCPGGHDLGLCQTSHVQKVKCNVCNRDLDGGSRCWSCVRCNYGSYHEGSTASRTAQMQQPQASNFAVSSSGNK